MVEFYSLTFPRFRLRKKEHKSYFGKNRTHDFRTSRCAGYLLDHSATRVILHNTKTLSSRVYHHALLFGQLNSTQHVTAYTLSGTKMLYTEVL